MKKLILGILLLGLLSGCSGNSDKPKTEIKIQMKNRTVILPDTILFYKDRITGICFASIQDIENMSFERTVCVPCDSLKNVQVHIIR